MGYFVWGPKFAISSSKGRKNSIKSQDLTVSLLEGKLHGEERRDMAVPKGCLAVYVGDEMRRFVIPTSYLRLPAFRALMERVAEEFGFHQTGGLRIPCNEEDFEEMLRVLEESESRNNKKKNKKNTPIRTERSSRY